MLPHPFRLYILSIFLLLLLGCNQSNLQKTDDGRIVIEFWHALGSMQGRAVNDMADDFNRSQDKYFVRAIYQGNYNALSQKLIASLYAGRNPAISQMYPGWTARYYEYGYMQPMQHFIDNDPEFAATYEDIYEIMRIESSLPNAEGEQVLVTLPFNKSVYVLMVNQTLLEELGFDAPPATWDEFLTIAEAMTIRPEGGGTPSRHGFATRTEIESFTVLALSAGAHVIDKDTLSINLDGPLNEKAMKFLHQLIDRNNPNRVGYVESDFLSNVFGSGRIGMYIASTASFTFNDMAVGNSFVWRAYRVPVASPDSPARTLMQGTNVGIFNNLPEEVQQGAWEFAKFITQPETTAKFAMATGYMPLRRSTPEAVPAFAEYLADDVRYANAVLLLDEATFDPRVMYWDSVRSIIGAELDGVLRGRIAPEQALASAARQVRTLQETQ